MLHGSHHETPRDSYPSGLSVLFTALTGLAVISAVFVRWSGLGSQSLWWDEGYTVWISHFPPKEIWRGVQTDTSPPLYYLLQHIWDRWFGTSEASLRGLSAFFETLSIPIFYLLAKKILVNKRVLTMATWLFALCAFQVEYAREARFYGLLLFLSLVGLYSAVVFLEKWSILSFSCLVISLSAGLYTHNMMLFYLPGMALLWFIYPSDLDASRRFMHGSLCAAIVLFSYSPWLPYLRRQMTSVEHQFWVSRPDVGSFVKSLSTLSGLAQDPLSIGARAERLLPLPDQFDREQSASQFAKQADSLPSLWKTRVLQCLGATIVVCCALGGLLRIAPINRRRTAALLGYVFVPILLVFLVSRISQSVYLNRAFIASSPIIPILLAAPIAFQTGKWRRRFIVINLVALMLISIALFGFLRHSQKEDWRGMTNYVIQDSSQRKLVMFAGSFGQVMFDYYSAKSSNPFPKEGEAGLPTTIDWSNPNILPDGTLQDEMLIAPLREAAESKGYDEIDVVVSRAPDHLIKCAMEYFATHCASLNEVDFVGPRDVQCGLPSAAEMNRGTH